jgi:hypothetical protein
MFICLFILHFKLIIPRITCNFATYGNQITLKSEECQHGLIISDITCLNINQYQYHYQTIILEVASGLANLLSESTACIVHVCMSYHCLNYTLTTSSTIILIFHYYNRIVICNMLRSHNKNTLPHEIIFTFHYYNRIVVCNMLRSHNKNTLPHEIIFIFHYYNRIVVCNMLRPHTKNTLPHEISDSHSGDSRGHRLLGKSATDFSEVHAVCYILGRIWR